MKDHGLSAHKLELRNGHFKGVLPAEASAQAGAAIKRNLEVMGDGHVADGPVYCNVMVINGIVHLVSFFLLAVVFAPKNHH